jgi:DNA-binding NtrC family response regulator
MIAVNAFSSHSVVRRIFAIAKILDVAACVAPINCQVLLVGPRGPGVQQIAQAIHLCSPRRFAPFIAAKCGLYPKEILESQLLGHSSHRVRALQSERSRIAAAEGGTLFVEQVQLTSARVQTELARLTEHQEYTDATTHETHAADVRLIASARRDLLARAEAGMFRKDLFSRLNVAAIEIPRELTTDRDIHHALLSARQHLTERSDTESIFSELDEASSPEQRWASSELTRLRRALRWLAMRFSAGCELSFRAVLGACVQSESEQYRPNRSVFFERERLPWPVETMV